jgi:transposase
VHIHVANQRRDFHHKTAHALVQAAEADRTLVKVNPAGTTQACSGCGEQVPKTLSERWHSCACGLSIGRDLNAALNILRLAFTPGLGWSLQAPTVNRYSVGASHAVA